MLYDSIKVKAKPVYDEDAVNLGYVGNVEELNVAGATNFVEAINTLKQNLDESIEQGNNNPLITQLDFIKGETFYNVPASQSVTLAYPNQDTNFFAQIQVDTFVASGETQSFEKWNFDTDTKNQWKVVGDPVVFEEGLIKFNNDSTATKKYAIVISATNGLDINKVNSIENFLFSGSEGIKVKFLISNNEKVSWLNKNFEEIPANIVDKTPFVNGWTAEELVALSEEHKLKLLENATNTLDIAICVEYTTEKPFIDYVNVDITRRGYWIPATFEGADKKVSIKKFTTGVEITNMTQEALDLKAVAILGKSSQAVAVF